MTKKAAKFSVVGKSVEKIDAISLATGRAIFVSDYPVENKLVGMIMHSPHAHARITSIDTSKAKKIDGVQAILTYQDVPRNVYTTAGQGYPEPSPYDTFVLDNKVRYVGDFVAGIAAETEAAAKAAIKAIQVEYEILPAVLDHKKAMDKGAPVIHDEKEAKMLIPVEYNPKTNLASRAEVEIGDVAKGLKKADVVVKNEYFTHYAQHTPIEPHNTLTYLDERGRLVIVTSTQVPFHVRRLVSTALDIPIKNIRVIKPRIGGGFGTKQEILLEPLCSALTMATGRPVHIEYTREEEFMASRTRHPITTYMESGVNKNGKLNTTKMEVLSNTGAYGSHALTVSMNCGSKTLPLYHAKNVAFKCEAVYTNLPVPGAYRGYGGTQASFAQEMQMDELAEAIGMDPIEFRLHNAIKQGEGSPVFRALGEGTEGVEQTVDSNGLERCIKEGAKAIGWDKKRKKKPKGTKRRGIGMCALMQGSSIPEIDMASVSLKMNEDGSFNMYAGATDIGTGSDTVLAQIAAEALGTTTDNFIVYSSDTDFTPFDVGAYASSTTYLSGEAARRAAEDAAEKIKAVAAQMLDVKKKSIVLKKGKALVKGSKKSVTFSEICTNALYVKDQHQIMGSDQPFLIKVLHHFLLILQKLTWIQKPVWSKSSTMSPLWTAELPSIQYWLKVKWMALFSMAFRSL
jgi:putative selenate reductase molybdopterin-binding subunit